ncbi:MAG: hypothetical protein PF569_09945 [Candidatus Woesearchaeota archaeon]|nr:hypothetical protein [Candidatus Woesearchaeota archaeon]
MALPTINIGINNTIQAGPEDGSLVYRYAPLKNLKGDDGDLIDFSVIAKDIKVDVNTPLQIDVEKSYDNSTNLILNDKNNPLKLINTRFYLKDSLNYKIADREGALDTNIYSKDNILSETSLIKRAKTISSLDFLGIEDGGILHVGLYTFYFKLADADGNESDFIAESGPVTCYVGSVDDPSSIRGGQYNEDSGKIVKFLLKNIDLSFSYINIYYTKSTGSNDVATLETFKIEDKFKIGSLDTSITITGYETHTKIGNEEINLQYAAFDAAKTSENCQKMTFIGGSQRNYDLYETLEKYSLSVVPEICLEEKISLLDEDFEKKSVLHKPEYYSAENTYYRLGH